MPETPEDALHRRIERLEAAVADLQRELSALRESAAATPAEPPPEPAAPKPSLRAPPRPARQRRKRRLVLTGAASTFPASSAGPWRGIDWLSRIGVGLLLLGIAFLFKYSIDQGWITPLVRVGFGLAVGAVLLWAGLRIRARQLLLSELLLGGSIATLYLTTFAAYDFYGLLPYGAAFVCMVAVTALAFGLSIRQDDALIAVVATLGGLGTPFILYRAAGSLPGLVGYTALVLGGAAAIYLSRGWRTLLYTFVAGGWIVMTVGYFSLDPLSTDWDRTALQLGVGFCWLVFGGVPALRAALHARRPDRWPAPRSAPATSWAARLLIRQPAYAAVLSAPLAALFLSELIWPFQPDTWWGWLALAGALLYTLLYAGLRRLPLLDLAAAHGLAATLLLTYGLSQLLGGTTLLLTLTAEAAALHLLAGRLQDRTLRGTGHALFALLGLWVAVRLLEFGVNLPAMLNATALSHLGVLLTACGIAFVLPQAVRPAYRLGAYLLWLALLLHELEALASGQAYVTIAWGLSAVLLLIVGVRRDTSGLRNVALATFLLVVAKLFLIDLARLEPLWRILLFLGFGGLFLLLGYFMPGLWKTPADQPKP